MSTRRSTPSTKLLSTAYHEAGHYVVHNLFKPDDCLIVSIVPDEEAGSLGHHEPIYGLELHPRQATPEERAENERLGASAPEAVLEYDPAEVEQYLIELYAGAAAELHFNPASDEPSPLLRDPTPEELAEYEDPDMPMLADSDWERAELFLAKQLAPDRAFRAQVRKECRTTAMRLVGEHWREIEAIATELLAQKTLDGLVADIILDLATGTDDEVRSSADYLARRLGTDKANAILARHGHKLRVERNSDDSTPS